MGGAGELAPDELGVGWERPDVDEAVSRLPAIKELDLSGNQISTVHASIAGQETLTYLNFENNMLTASHLRWVR